MALNHWLALRAPRRVADIHSLRDSAKPRIAAAARLAPTHVGVHRRPPGEAERVLLPDAGPEQRLGLAEDEPQFVVVEFAHAAPWVDSRVEETLVLPNVSDACDRSLVHHGIPDSQQFTRWMAHPPDRLIQVESIIEQVRPQVRNWRVVPKTSLFDEFDHGRAEIDDDGVINLEDKAYFALRLRPGVTRAVDMPRPVHPQVTAERESVVEANQEVLPGGANFRDRLANDLFYGRDGSWPVAARRKDDLAQQRAANLLGEPVKGVTFRHGPATPCVPAAG